MKIFAIILLIGLVLTQISCTNTVSDIEPIQDIENNESLCQTRSAEQALFIAAKARNEFGYNQSRFTFPLSLDNVVTVNNKLSRSGTDPLLYIVNFGDDQGYVIVSANANKEAIIGITDSGCINDIDSVDNPGLSTYLHAVVENEQNSISELGTITPVNRRFFVYDTIASGSVSPRVSVRWGQRLPEGYFFSNGYCGCAITACAQILSYHEEPSSIYLEFPERDMGQLNLNWANIKNNVISANLSPIYLVPSYYSEEYYDLARICREIAYRIETIYGSNAIMYQEFGTGTSLSYIKGVMPTLLPNHYFSGIIQEIPNPKLHLGNGIMMVAGKEYDNEYGHAWLIDGYRYYTERYRVYEEIPLTLGPGHPVSYYTQLVSEDIYDIVYSHVNWGWCGDSNGYFNMSYFNTQNPYRNYSAFRMGPHTKKNNIHENFLLRGVTRFRHLKQCQYSVQLRLAVLSRGIHD